ncbi:hypothetical protein JTB14_037263 [Gonioctena quinquepunctata]|nr:hypothetical protein JTB14_037263 [Gonioctena quinquepunctata]
MRFLVQLLKQGWRKLNMVFLTGRIQQGERNDDQLPEHRKSPPRTPLRTPPRTPPRTLSTSPLRKPPSITTIPTNNFFENSFVFPYHQNTTTAHIVKLNEKRKLNDNEMTTRKDIKAKNPKKIEKCSSEETSVREKRQKYTKGKKNKKRRKSSGSNDSSTEDESEEATCIFCSELNLNSKAEGGWIRCQHREGWAHEACAGAGEKTKTKFLSVTSVRNSDPFPIQYSKLGTKFHKFEVNALQELLLCRIGVL